MNSEETLKPKDSTRKKCLLILPRPVFPVIGGYAIKNKELVRILSEKYDLTLVVITDKDSVKEEEEFYKNHSTNFKVFKYKKYRYLLNAFLSLFSKEPLQVGYFYFREVQNFVNQVLPDQDVAIGALIRAMKYIPKNGKYVRVFDMVDSIAINYMRSLENVKSGFWRLIYSIENKRLFRAEQSNIENSHVTFLFNWKEMEHWKKYGDVRLLPHGVNERLFSYNNVNPEYAKGVSFIGKMDYQPNIDAVIWYLRNVHSKVGEEVPFYIVGASPTKEIYAEAEKYKNVTVTGFVEDPFEIIGSTFAVVAPMQTGAGIQNKVLEAMGLGQTVVTTTLSAFPIKGAIDGEHLLVADTPEDFIRIIKELKGNPNKCKTIGEAARLFIENNYTWKSYGEKYVEGIESHLNK